AERDAPRRGAPVARPRRGARRRPGRRGRAVPGPAGAGGGPVTAAGAPAADTALGIAAAVRSGTRSAVEVVEEHLTAIAARDGELNAFNLVTADQARQAAIAIDERVAAGEDPGPLAGVPVAQGQPVHPGRAHHLLVAHPQGLAAAQRRH